MKKIIIALMLGLAGMAYAATTEACLKLAEYQEALANNTPIDGYNLEDDNGVVTYIRTAEEAIPKQIKWCENSKKPLPRLGMTTKQVAEKSSYGKPLSINTSGGRWGVHEQWVYGHGSYLYFENGRLTSWQH